MVEVSARSAPAATAPCREQIDRGRSPNAVAERTTIVVICREWTDLTTRCLAACLRLYPGAEVIVVADTPPAADVPAGVRLLPADRVALGAKRNLAVRAAGRTFVAFIDDDAYPEAGWLENAVRVLEGDATIGIVGGPTPAPADDAVPSRAVDNALRSFLVTGHHWSGASAMAHDCDFVSSCNLVMRREEYVGVGGMDEECFTGDDVVLCARVRRAGLRIRFVPDAVVWHSSRTLAGFAAQRFCRGYDELAVWRRSGLRQHLLYLASAAFVLALVVVFPLAVWLGWPGRGACLAIACAYVVICCGEALRTSRALREVPGTLLAIWIGNLGPGAGMLWSLTGLPLDLHRWYRLAPQPPTPHHG